ncbi:MAG TPA: TonB-dependent siderophore receptor [Vicinamibacterales bacterium]|nr:TonB-dependent siderophore receptor [Vicinamibacterales bacterium]
MEWSSADSKNAPEAQDTRAIAFSIRPQPLSDVLAAFEQMTGVRVVLADPAIAMIQSPGVVGTFTPRQALQELLAGTSVAFTFTARNAVMLDLRAPGEFVTVRGEGPSVTSPKFTEPLRDIPQTITVVPAAVIQAQGATTLRDVLRNVTGISIQAGEGGVPAGDNLSIRGFSARTDLLVDGVRDMGGYTRDPFNVEQVEVVKGPSSSIAGRGSTGGVINMATKTPHLGATRDVSIGIGAADYKRSTLDVNQPITGIDGAAFRFNAMWTDSDTPGRDAVTNQRWGIGPSLAFGIGTPTRVTADYTHLSQDNVPDYGIPWVPAANVPLQEYADQAPPVDFSNFYGLTSRDYEDTRTDIATVRAEHDFNPSLSLRSIVRAGRTKRDSLITSPRFESNTSTAIRRTDWKSRDQSDGIMASQTDVTARFRTGTIGHSLVTGLELTRERSENWNRIEQGGAQPSTDLFRPESATPYISSLARDGAVNDATARGTALYAFDTLNVASKLELSGGVRWDRLSLDYRTVDTAANESTLERTDDMVSWRGGAVYKPRPNGTVYLGLGTSLNPSTEGLSLSASTALLDPEKSRSFEVGTKWDALGGRAGFTAAVFNTSKTNARTPGVNPGDPPTVLQGKHTVSGVELGVNGNVTNEWQLFGGYTFMDSEIKRSNTLAEVGKEFGNTPNHSFSLWTTYRLPRGIDVGGGAQYVGDRFNSNTGTRTAPAYWVIDAMAAYRVTEQLSLRVNGQNIANERYIDRVGGGHFIPGPGRSVTLTADIGF